MLGPSGFAVFDRATLPVTALLVREPTDVSGDVDQNSPAVCSVGIQVDASSPSRWQVDHIFLGKDVRVVLAGIRDQADWVPWRSFRSPPEAVLRAGRAAQPAAKLLRVFSGTSRRRPLWTGHSRTAPDPDKINP